MHTAFGGPGARDAFALVTRAVTEGRYDVDASLARPKDQHLSRLKLEMADRVMSARAVDVYDELPPEPGP